MSNQTNRSRRSRLQIFITLLFCIIGLTFFGLSTASIYRNRIHHIQEARVKSRSQAQLLGENTASLIYAADLSLLSFCSIISDETGENAQILPSSFDLLTSQLIYLPQIQEVFFINPHQEIEYTTGSSGKIHLANFDRHKDAWLEFSIETRHSETGHTKLLMSRRVESKNGKFLGVLTAVMDSGFFYDRHSAYLTLDAAAVILFDNQKKILAAWMNAPDVHSWIISPDNTILLPESMDSTVKGGTHTVETSSAMISTYQIRGFPYHVAVVHAWRDILQNWYSQTLRDIFILCAAFGATVFTMVLAFRQRKQRKKAEHQLIQHQADLEKIVQERTDQLKLTNRELTEKNRALETAMGEIKTLSGLLPICMHCKKIRDDSGYWNQLEVYLQKHSNARFSHGICQECTQKHYPGIVDPTSE